MQALENTILFQKYQIRRVLGTGGFGRVYLAEHLGLSQLRAIKQIPKVGNDCVREAQILKQLRHPGIPIVYDLEEDFEYIYIIEEFLEGESLYALVSRLGYLTEAKMISYGIQLCQILNYLHFAEPNPILYLDLQPKNLLLCHNILKLVDFDQALFLTQANPKGKRYGTVGYAAPEQYNTEPLDQRTDIYAIGALLYYMGTGMLPEPGNRKAPEAWGRELTAIIFRCLESDRTNRYASVPEVLKDLEQLQSGVFKRNASSTLTISLAGSKPGAGVTHVALGLCTFLNSLGISCLYRERNQSGAIHRLMELEGLKPDSCGICHIFQCALMPSYGACASLVLPFFQVEIRDYGCNPEEAIREIDDGDLWLVGGVSRWEIAQTRDAVDRCLKGRSVILLLNHMPLDRRIGSCREFAEIPVYRLPYIDDPFLLSEHAVKFYEALWKTKEGTVSRLERRSWKEKFFQLRKRISFKEI